MKYPKYAISLILMVFFTYNAQAGGYMGADYVFISTDVTDHTGIQLKGGYAFNDFLAIEGRTLVSSSNEDYHGVNVEIDSLHTVMLKLSLPITDSAKVYGMFGHSRGKVTASYMGYSESGSDNSSSFGFGASYEVLEAYTLTAEYSRPMDDVDTFSLGVSLNF